MSMAQYGGLLIHSGDERETECSLCLERELRR